MTDAAIPTTAEEFGERVFDSVLGALDTGFVGIDVLPIANDLWRFYELKR